MTRSTIGGCGCGAPLEEDEDEIETGADEDEDGGSTNALSGAGYRPRLKREGGPDLDRLGRLRGLGGPSRGI